MPPDGHPPPLRVRVTDQLGRPLRRPGLARWLATVAPARARGDVAIALVSEAAMRRMNRQFAGVDHATDVLSFATAGPVGAKPAHLGDIVIASAVAARQARALGHSLATELRVLALHGLLHLLGYDHVDDDGEMARVERRLRRKGGLREGLIDRAGRAGGAGRASRAGGGKA